MIYSKLLFTGLLCGVLSGCYQEQRSDWWERHPVLIERAEEACNPAGGVYKWKPDGGNVMCYDLSIYNTFTQEFRGEAK